MWRHRSSAEDQSNHHLEAICDVTFYGQDQVGNEINVTGSILIEFGNFGDF